MPMRPAAVGPRHLGLSVPADDSAEAAGCSDRARQHGFGRGRVALLRDAQHLEDHQ